MQLEFLIPRRPVSHQTKKRENLQGWKEFVRTIAAQNWIDSPLAQADIELFLIYLYDTDPVDVDNIVKPIQDSLIGLVYEDDVQVTDMEAHRRQISGTFDVTRCPALLLQEILSGTECVYVRLKEASPMEHYL